MLVLHPKVLEGEEAALVFVDSVLPGRQLVTFQADFETHGDLSFITFCL